jgi:hypothetical protein
VAAYAIPGKASVAQFFKSTICHGLQADACRPAHLSRSESTPGMLFPAQSARLKAVSSATGYQLPSSAECTSSANTPGKMLRVTLHAWGQPGMVQLVGRQKS